MHPAFSVIFLTTLIGAGQGLFLALYSGEVYAVVELLPAQDGRSFYAAGSAIALVLLGLGLFASFFHLGHPERAWRAAAMWRTSWLSREVIILPLFMGLLFLYGVVHYAGWNPPLVGTNGLGTLTILLGALATVACFALYVSTAMIYASIRLLQEWATPLTVVNYTLLGAASGFTLATAFAAYTAPGMLSFYGAWAVILTLAALATRSASLIRNARIRHKSTLQTAIGVRHNQIQQKSQGAMGGSFNTREFFHGRSPSFLKSVRLVFLLLVFPAPIALIGIGLGGAGPEVFVAAFATQYLGLIAERWYFFAQANHPQNLYYQTV
jgi:sulfite dehydrogenase (quinone) subunit SoeC